MKVAIGQRPYNGPWGGGNRFVAALSKALGERGHDVVYELSSNDIDVIVITDPRVRLPNVSIGAGAILLTVIGGDAPAADDVGRRDARPRGRRSRRRRGGLEGVAHALTASQRQCSHQDRGVTNGPRHGTGN